jgi:hypothetical protein
MPSIPSPTSPQQQTVLRVKRSRESEALDLLTVELAAKAPKRARTVPSAATHTALRLLSLALTPLPPAETVENGEKKDKDRLHGKTRRVTFRRIVDPAQPGPRAVIGKARVVDVAQKALRRVGQTAVAVEVLKRAEENDAAANVKAEEEAKTQANEGVASDKKSVRFLCNGVEMVRYTDEPEDAAFVYDLYMREEPVEASPVSGTNLDARLPAEAAMAEADTERKEAVVLASDLPEDLRFHWDGEEVDGESSDDGAAQDPAHVDDMDDSEGSIDYPSTPDEAAYVGEVVSDPDSESDSDDEGGYNGRRNGPGRRMLAPMFGARSLLDDPDNEGSADASPLAFGDYAGFYAGHDDDEDDEGANSGACSDDQDDNY